MTPSHPIWMGEGLGIALCIIVPCQHGGGCSVIPCSLSPGSPGAACCCPGTVGAHCYQQHHPTCNPPHEWLLMELEVGGVSWSQCQAKVVGHGNISPKGLLHSRRDASSQKSDSKPATGHIKLFCLCKLELVNMSQ